ncbi:MAG: glycoside hydrolase family 2 protein [Anaerolineae bacterium]
MNNMPHAEYPRPQFARAEWLNLNGTWGFAFDDREQGIVTGWNQPGHHLAQEIVVPFAFEAPASGIGDPAPHEVVWYRREFDLLEDWSGRRVHLHFGAVDFQADVWVNGQHAGQHRGGYTAFSFDVTDLLNPGTNVLTVRAEDRLTVDQPRGKQALTDQSHGIWYTRSTGIWRTVWLEPVSAYHIKDWRVVTNLAAGEVEITAWTARPEPQTLELTLTDADGVRAANTSVAICGGSARARLAVQSLRPWSPEDPHLYSATLTLRLGDEVVDKVETYVGLREVGVCDGKLTVNGQPCYQKLVLDQAYWPEGVYTAPDDAAIRGEVEWVKRLGFNGVRKHQVSSDPRFLYWADRLGILVWQDMPGQTISRRGTPSVRAVGQAESNFIREYAELIREARNAPSVIVWVPFNETWGLYGISNDAATQAFMADVVRMTRDWDPTRIVVDNDGWEHGNDTDLFTVHDYTRDPETLRTAMADWNTDRAARASHRIPLYIPGAHYGGQPVMLTEYGGLGMLPEGEEAPPNHWGYGSLEPSPDALLKDYRGLQEALAATDLVSGYCYTQLTDVEQEVNGLLTFNRKPKVDPDAVRALNDMVGQ